MGQSKKDPHELLEQHQPESCPVDPASRAAWLSKAGASSTAPSTSSTSASTSCSSNTPNSSVKSPLSSANFTNTRPLNLNTQRQISTIPRASPSPVPNSASASPSPLPAANAELDSGHDRQSGNWVYPSEKMFFDAMRRKQYDPRAADMATVVPIHNAVNEKAWAEIKSWERAWGSERCGGPKLLSFSGDASKMTPRARWNTILGYTQPFDRHDWVVDRCGTRVDYVIDFYPGRDDTGKAGSLNFYLDVRPKLNTIEGWKMRAARFVGLA